MGSTVSRFPIDQFLRNRGFRIEHRPNSGPVIWSRGGKKFTFAQAQEIAKAEAVADAKRKQREQEQAGEQPKPT